MIDPAFEKVLDMLAPARNPSTQKAIVGESTGVQDQPGLSYKTMPQNNKIKQTKQIKE